jgi:hypothetical protein
VFFEADDPDNIVRLSQETITDEMQSKILEFEIKDDRIGALYGDYGSLKPLTIHGIAHAFKINENVLLTLYSKTGTENGGASICSADIRLNVDIDSLENLIDQLTDFKNRMFSNKLTTERSSDNKDIDIEINKNVTEKLGPTL